MIFNSFTNYFNIWHEQAKPVRICKMRRAYIMLYYKYKIPGHCGFSQVVIKAVMKPIVNTWFNCLEGQLRIKTGKTVPVIKSIKNIPI